MRDLDGIRFDVKMSVAIFVTIWREGIPGLQTRWIGEEQRVVQDVCVAVERLRVGGFAGGEERIDGGEAAVGVSVHTGLGKVERGLGVLFVARETLANAVLSGLRILARDRPMHTIRIKLLTERQEIPTRNNIPRRIRQHPRTPEHIRRRVISRRIRWRRSR